METAVHILRWAIFLSSLAIMAKALRGFIAFGLGDQWPSTFVRSVVFLYAMVGASIQSSYLLEGYTPAPATSRGMVTLTLLLLTNAYVVWGLWWVNSHPIGKMRIAYRHIAEVMAIAQLADVDPAAAERLAQEANRLSAERMISGRVEDERSGD